MRIRTILLSAFIGISGIVAIQAIGDADAPSKKPAVIPSPDPMGMGQGLAELAKTQNPAIGSTVSVYVEPPIGELTGKLTGINDHWTIIDSGPANLGVWWIPMSKVQSIRVLPK